MTQGIIAGVNNDNSGGTDCFVSCLMEQALVLGNVHDYNINRRAGKRSEKKVDKTASYAYYIPYMFCDVVGCI